MKYFSVVIFTLAASVLIFSGFSIIAADPGDPDPDGYVSAAKYIASNKAIDVESRRPPGYPALIAVVSSVVPGEPAQIARYTNLVLSAMFGFVTSVILMHYCGVFVAVIYSILYCINSYILVISTTGLADVLLSVHLYLAALVVLYAAKSSGKVRVALFVVYALVVVAGISVHPIASMRLLLVACAFFFVIVARSYFSGRPELAGNQKAPSFLLYIIFCAFGINVFMQGVFINKNTSLYSAWVPYRMLLCLPATKNATSEDVKLENAKSIQSKRQGYRVELVTPTGMVDSILSAVERMPKNEWFRRLITNPSAYIGCTKSEIKAKYHTFIKNITPFTPYGNGLQLYYIDVNPDAPNIWGTLFYWVAYDDKSLITSSYPANMGTPRDLLFWDYGINIFSHTRQDATVYEVYIKVFVEVIRIALVCGITLYGALLLVRRNIIVGLAVPLSMLFNLALISIALPIETRYFLPYLPYIYICQALTFVEVLSKVISKTRFIKSDSWCVRFVK